MTQPEAARLLGVGLRTVQHWEIRGATSAHGWAYVGAAYRVGGAPAAQRTLDTLAQAAFLLGDGDGGAGR